MDSSEWSWLANLSTRRENATLLRPGLVTKNILTKGNVFVRHAVTMSSLCVCLGARGLLGKDDTRIRAGRAAAQSTHEPADSDSREQSARLASGRTHPQLKRRLALSAKPRPELKRRHAPKLKRRHALRLAPNSHATSP